MKRFISIFLAILMIVPALASAAQADLAAAPRAVIEQLYQGEYAQVFDHSTPDVQAGLGSAESLQALWAQIGQAYGDYQGITAAAAQMQSGLTVAQITCAHKTASITYAVVLDADGLLTGLSVANVQPNVPESTADTSLFVSEPIKLRAGEADETQGLLTLPIGEGPFPAVIMMHGSGATDMNEAAYGIAPFRDLAEGLATVGVASIRYDKYPYAHAKELRSNPALIAGLDIQTEYILDAQAALALLQADSRIGDIYLLGHSEGAMIGPRVMQALGAENIAGAVLLEGSPLAMWIIQYHQNLALLSGLSEADRKAAIAQLDAEAARLPELEAMTPKELQATTFFGLSAYYQMDLLSVDPAQTAVTLDKPLFISQGGKDWQVTPADGMDAWKAALPEQLAVTYKFYPDMNHMLCDMQGPSAGDTSDYQPGSTVSAALVQDIAAWILGQ